MTEELQANVVFKWYEYILEHMRTCACLIAPCWVEIGWYLWDACSFSEGNREAVDMGD